MEQTTTYHHSYREGDLVTIGRGTRTWRVIFAGDTGVTVCRCGRHRYLEREALSQLRQVEV